MLQALYYTKFASPLQPAEQRRHQKSITSPQESTSISHALKISEKTGLVFSSYCSSFCTKSSIINICLLHVMRAAMRGFKPNAACAFLQQVV